MRPFYYFLLYGLSDFGTVSSTSLRSGPISAKSRVQVFDVSTGGKQTEVLMNADSKVQQVLCSEKVISRLERCDGTVPDTIDAVDSSKLLYPMSAAYEAAVASGHACPLPSPFMSVSPVTHRCCVGNESHVWPNFCPNAAKIGSHVDSSIWDVGGSVHVYADDRLENQHRERLHAHRVNDPALRSVPLTAGVYQIGRPDVPQHYSRWRPNLGVILTYFFSGMAWVCLAIYVQGWLDDEASILKGQNRERLLKQMKAHDEEDDGNDSESSVASLSPAHGLMGRDGLTEAGKVSMAFGLLPSLPRGRSANSSTMNTPRR